MTIAEKLTQVAENVSKVYQAGVEEGKAQGGEAKYVEASVSGKIARADYVSETPHEVVVQLTSDTITDFSGITVSCYGKNLIPFPYSNGMSKEMNGITYTVNQDRSITVKGTATGDSYFMLQRNVDYGEQMNAISGKTATNGTYTINKGLFYSVSNKTLSLNIVSGATVNETFYPQVEAGISSTEYQPYIEPQVVTANADGTVSGIFSVSPTMTFISSEDVTINVTYRKNWGAQSAYDEFWANFRSGMNSGIWSYCFAGKGWNDNTFKPPFDIAPTASSNAMFYYNGVSNIKQSFEDCGVKLDMSKATSVTNMFNNCNTVALPELDFRNCKASNNSQQSIFAYSGYLQSIDKVYFAEGIPVTNCFSDCGNLKHVIFGGTFASTGLTLQDSKNLDMESIVSIIDALSLKASGLSITLSKQAVNKAFGIDVDDETTYMPGSPGEEYYFKISTKGNWTINYI